MSYMITILHPLSIDNFYEKLSTLSKQLALALRSLDTLSDFIIKEFILLI
jgi:hypothetical protein